MRDSRKRSERSPSTGRWRGERRSSGPDLDVYLFPAVLGDGRGDVVEVLNVGRWLHAAGYRCLLYRSPSEPLPQGVDRSFEWPPCRRVSRPAMMAARALTVAPDWGVTAAPPRDEPFGAAGPWWREAASIEDAYGRDRTLHVSLGEFCRTLTSLRQVEERYREAGRPAGATRRWLSSPRGTREAREMHRLYARYRGFGARNVAHLFPSFVPVHAFRREFPAAILCGPIAPFPEKRLRRRSRTKGRSWLWYASPGSSARFVGPLSRAVAELVPPRRLTIRSRTDRPVPRTEAKGTRVLPTVSAPRWRRLRDDAEVTVVSGSRTLIEALTRGRPFLYFNGLTGTGRSVRTHRPEKLDSLLALWRRLGVRGSYVRDLREFARGRDVSRVVGQAASNATWRTSFPSGRLSAGFATPFDRGEQLVVAIADAFSRSPLGSEALVAELRTGAPGAFPRVR